MTRPRLQARHITIALVALFIAYPLLFGADRYTIELITVALVFGIFAISVDLLWGYGGMLNLGAAASFGLGAYSYAIIMRSTAFDATYLAYAGAILMPMALAAVVGYPAFRSRTGPIYFALITLAVTLILERLTLLTPGFTGGSNGLLNIPRPTLGIPELLPIAVNTPLAYYYFVGAACILVFFLTTRMVNSPFGHVLRAIRQHDIRTETLGYNVNRYRLISFMIAAGLGGFAGALFAPVSGIVYPALFGVLMTVTVFVWVAVGGQGTLVGPFAAAFVLKLLESFLSGVAVFTYHIMLGVLFILVVLLFPEGIAGVVKRVRRARARPAPVEQPTP